MSSSRRSCREDRVDLRRTVLLYLGVICLAANFTKVDFAVAQSPTPPGPLTQTDLESILSSLRAAGLTSSATVIQTAVAAGGLALPNRNFTIFAPANTALNAALVAYPNPDKLFLYHVASEPLPLDALARLGVGTQIPTMLPGNHLVVTHNSPGDCRIDAEAVVLADLCNISGIACHTVNGVFNSTLWGLASLPPVGVPAGAPAAPPVPVPAPRPAGAPALPPAGFPSIAPVGPPPLLPPVLPPAAPFPPPGAPGGPGGPGGPPAPAPGPPSSGAPAQVFAGAVVVWNVAAVGVVVSALFL